MGTKRVRLTRAQVLKRGAERNYELAAESFGRACRSEHEALAKVLEMLGHIVGMPMVPGVVEKAQDAVRCVVLGKERLDRARQELERLG